MVVCQMGSNENGIFRIFWGASDAEGLLSDGLEGLIPFVAL